MIQREHTLSKHLKNWVRDAVAAEHELFVHDRSKPSSQFAHMREKARGIRRTEPDTLLEVVNFPGIYCELKWPPNKVMPGDEQDVMLQRLRALGRVAFWVQSVTEYYRTLDAMGVALHRNAAFLAQLNDAAVLSEIAKAEAKIGKAEAKIGKAEAKIGKAPSSRPRGPRATAGKIRRAHESGYWSP